MCAQRSDLIPKGGKQEGQGVGRKNVHERYHLKLGLEK